MPAKRNCLPTYEHEEIVLTLKKLEFIYQFENMTSTTFMTSLLFFVSLNLFSCNGLKKSDHEKTETESVQIGKMVVEMDQRIWRIVTYKLHLRYESKSSGSC